MKVSFINTPITYIAFCDRHSGRSLIGDVHWTPSTWQYTGLVALGREFSFCMRGCRNIFSWYSFNLRSMGCKIWRLVCIIRDDLKSLIEISSGRIFESKWRAARIFLLSFLFILAWIQRRRDSRMSISREIWLSSIKSSIIPADSHSNSGVVEASGRYVFRVSKDFRTSGLERYRSPTNSIIAQLEALQFEISCSWTNLMKVGAERIWAQW